MALCVALTTLIFPILYPGLIELDATAIALLVLRNVLLAGLVWTCAFPRPRVWIQVVEGAAGLARQHRRRLGHLALFGLALWVLLNSLYKNTDYDVFFHLRVGEDLLAGLPWPRVDAYSGTAQGRPFVAHSWGSEILFVLIHRAFGHEGLSILRALAALVVAILLWSVGRASRSRNSVFPLVAIPGTFLTFLRLQVRPEIFSLIFATAFVALFAGWLRHRRWSRLLPVLAIQLIWTNMHGGYLLGPLLLFAFGGMGLASAWLDSRRGLKVLVSRSESLSLAALGVGCLVITLLNPYGWDLHRYSLQMFFGNAFIHESIIEWLPFWRVEKEIWVAAYLCLFGLALGGLWVRGRRVRVFFILWLAFALVFSVRSMRFAPYLILIGLFPLLQVVGPGLLRILSVRSRFLMPAATLALLLPLIVVSAGYGHVHIRGGNLPLGVGADYVLPEKALLALKERQYAGRVFVAYREGGYLIHAAPEMKPVMDARIDVYSEELFTAYMDALLGGADLLSYLDKYQVDAVMMRFVKEHVPLFATLQDTPEWEGIYQVRKGYFVFVRRPPVR
jgi:hypothetical protein